LLAASRPSSTRQHQRCQLGQVRLKFSCAEFPDQELVTLSAKLLLANRALLSDRGCDWFVGMSVRPPAATV